MKKETADYSAITTWGVFKTMKITDQFNFIRCYKRSFRVS